MPHAYANLAIDRLQDQWFCVQNRFVGSKPAWISNVECWSGVPSSTPQVQWQKVRQELKQKELDWRTAATLLLSCGILHLDRVHQRVDDNWTEEHLGNSLLEYLTGLQRAIRILAANGAEAIKDARKNEERRQEALTTLRNQPSPHGLPESVVRRIRRENPELGSTATVTDVIACAIKPKETSAQMPGYKPLRSVDPVGAPDIMTRLLLNLEGVGARFTLDDNALPVVSLFSHDPLGYLLLLEYSDALLNEGKLCARPRCGQSFGGRGRTCSDKCADYLKKVKTRMIDRTLQECDKRNGSDSTDVLTKRARTLAEALAGGPVQITTADVERRRALAQLRGER